MPGCAMWFHTRTRGLLAPANRRERVKFLNAQIMRSSWAFLGPVAESCREQAGMTSAVDSANGPPNPDAHVRLFGKDEADIRVKFYRDSAAWCPYCQRVWLLLEEKQIPYRMEKVNMRSYGDKPPAFLKKVPAGLLPVIELDGQIVTESADIMLLLEEAFLEKPMLPADSSNARLGRVVASIASLLPGTTSQGNLAHGEANLRDAAFALMQLERDLFALWCRWLFRPLGPSGEARAQQALHKALEMVDNALAQVGGCGPFFLGSNISMVDMMFAPFLERQAASLLYWKGYQVRNGVHMNITKWFEALEQRETYAATQSDYYTHCWDIPPQYGNCYPSGGHPEYAGVIDGQDGHWRLPLPLLMPDSVEPRSNVLEDGKAFRYKVEAGAKLVGNHAAVTRFCLRAIGKPGERFYAPLAEPDAVPDERKTDLISNALQCTAVALLQGTETAQAGLNEATWLGLEHKERTDNAKIVHSCLGYLRDRVGVPRDLQLPAARQLRAHLNWTIEAVASAA